MSEEKRKLYNLAQKGKVLDLLPETHWITHEKRLVPNWKYKEPIELYDTRIV